MALPIIALAAVAAVVAGNLAYDYLFPNSELPEVNDTTALSDAPPFVPPFLLGQCLGVEYNRIKWTDTVVRNNNNGNRVGVSVTEIAFIDVPRIGRITSVTVNASSTSYSFRITGANGATNAGGAASGGNPTNSDVFSGNPTNIELIRSDNVTDICGNVANPNQDVAPSIPSGGIPTNTTPVITPSDELVNAGLPVVFAPSALSALAGLALSLANAIASAQAAANALDAIKATANAVDKLAKTLDEYKNIFEQLRKYLNKKEQEDDAKKRYLIRQYGTILRDGYLNITPRPAPVGFDPIMLDFLCSNIPNGLGRFFGNKSYNWFRYTELGSICFLSPTLGVLSVHKIEHVRTSIAIPELAVGFTYNMGLNGIIKARVSMLYTQEKPNPTP